jgi:ribosomal protein S18 acetylase RimI-like enzyme
MEIVRLDQTHLRKAAVVAAAAFYDYPMFELVFPDPRRRARYLPWYLRNVLKCALSYGEIYATPDIRGVAFALLPGHTQVSIWEFIRHGFLPTPIVLGIRQYVRSMKYLELAEQMQEELTRGRPHYYLWGLAVKPTHQRQGIGEALMRAATGKADALGVPVYLETHVRSNVQYYQKRGFRLIRTVESKGHGFPLLCMLREPSTTGAKR